MPPFSFSRASRGLPAAFVSSLALLATLLLAPEAPWRLPLAIVGGVWAPGYALLAAFHPLHREGLTGLERHALGFASGILAAPVVGVGVSLAFGFREIPVAATLCAITLLASAAGLLRAEGDAPWTLSRPPGTRATLAICAATLVVAAALWAVPTPGASRGAPVALALTGPDGDAASLPLVMERGESVTVLVEVMAGDAPADGALTVTWAPLEGGPARVLLAREVSLPAKGAMNAAVTLPTDVEGGFALRARWTGPEARETHAWIRVAEAGT